jgi:hypothetical protein
MLIYDVTSSRSTFLAVRHGRDNKLHVWDSIVAVQTLGDAANQQGLKLPEPPLRYSLDVNALNFCRLSLLPVDNRTDPDAPFSELNASSSRQTTDGSDAVALLALPNLVDSSVVRP